MDKSVQQRIEHRLYILYFKRKKEQHEFPAAMYMITNVATLPLLDSTRPINMRYMLQ